MEPEWVWLKEGHKPWKRMITITLYARPLHCNRTVEPSWNSSLHGAFLCLKYYHRIETVHKRITYWHGEHVAGKWSDIYVSWIFIIREVVLYLNCPDRGFHVLTIHAIKETWTLPLSRIITPLYKPTGPPLKLVIQTQYPLKGRDLAIGCEKESPSLLYTCAP